jgi:phospholipase/carboxylesterase
VTDRLLVVLHGFEDEPDRRVLPPSLDPSWSVVQPRGPVELAGGPAWFRNDEHGPVEADVTHSLDQLEALLGELLREARGDPAIVVGGSSQGGAMALAVALRSGPPLAGLFCVNGWLPALDTVTFDPGPLVAERVKVLIVGSTDDEVVPVEAGRSTARYLERAGVDVTWVELAAGHTVGSEAQAAVGEWLVTVHPDRSPA